MLYCYTYMTTVGVEGLIRQSPSLVNCAKYKYHTEYNKTK